ncbi:hypothetical protein ETH_00013500 [Eimeria tenella]|uniref:Uncharacterized protein n=1 Tax=Eimeria tenella TaxID=5802 RepID=U6L441_EIMTE|nr:hypothetical protein ETH_00013500 [Eimeria tenella]CDJ43394.1 hypothetical protein ETH_00013500 [Eimeria tenella]|eukprot:XP_013234144.1 hypothetical protein ETH_00013500 [Eimeria tenella]
MAEAVHYELSPSLTNNRDSGLLPQATRPISGLPAVGYSTALKLLVYSAIVLLVTLCARRQLHHLSKNGCRTGDSDLGGDISPPSQDSDEDRPSGDLKFDDGQTSPDAHDEYRPQSDAASTQAPGTGAAEEGVSSSWEDEAPGDAAAAAPEAAADDEDDDSNSNCGQLVYDVVRSDQESTMESAESTGVEPHDAQAAAGEVAEKHKLERQGRARWMGPLAGLLETAGNKISRIAAKSDVTANPAAGELAGETAASSSKASQPQEGGRFTSKLAFGDSNSPHYRDLGKPYDFPNLKALNYTELRQELLKFAESMGNLCSPHSEPFRATVKADCEICGVGTVTFHIELVEEDMKNQGALSKLRGRLFSDNPFSKRFAERFARDLLALVEELSLEVSEHAQRTEMPNDSTHVYSTVMEKPAAAACTGKVSLKIFGVKAN